MAVRITYFVHGTTTDNEQGLATGWLPGRLSKLGREQSRELGALVEGKPFDAVFCSDLKRAIDSAELAFGDRYKVVRDRRLRECDYGDYTEGPSALFDKRKEEFVDRSFPGGECYRDVEKRVADFLAFLRKGYDGMHVAVVAHQGPQLALEVLAKGKSWKQAIDGDWRNTGKWQPGWDYSF